MIDKPKKKKAFYKKKRYIVPVFIFTLLIAFRLYLPILVKDYVNKTLADIPGYYGQIDGIDISLYKGAYTINGMYLNKIDAGTHVPFIKFPETNISIEWKSLFQGDIVAEIIMNHPEIIYVFEDQLSDSEGGVADVDDWTDAITDLVPLEINHFEMHDGKFAFVQITAEPTIDLAIDNVELTADNLRNVVEKDRVLPSPITATGTSFGSGEVKLDGAINIIKEVPDMDISFSLEKANAQALNDFTNYYAGIDFDSGTVELYSEIAIADGFLKGYMKPLLINSKLIGKEDGFIETLWEGLVGFFKFALKNHGTNTIATEIPLEGNLNDVNAGAWSTVIGIFKNGWIKAFKGETDNTIEYKDAFQDDNELTSKEKRKLKREERKQERISKKEAQDNSKEE